MKYLNSLTLSGVRVFIQTAHSKGLALLLIGLHLLHIILTPMA